MTYTRVSQEEIERAYERALAEGMVFGMDISEDEDGNVSMQFTGKFSEEERASYSVD